MNKILLGLMGVAAIFATSCASVSGAENAQDEVYTAAEVNLSEERLDVLLAPIALYPDALLAQVLMASVYPLEVVEAARWQSAHATLTDSARDEALNQKTWRPAVKAIAMIPEVLQKMNAELSWMQELGDAVVADQSAVMARVQVLRQQAQQAGHLATNDKQIVEIEANAEKPSEKIIVIKEAQPRVVYVPVYDPYVVYGVWGWATPPLYWAVPGITLSSGYYWGSGFGLSFNLWGGFNWTHRYLTVNAPIYRQTHHVRATRYPATGAHRWIAPPRAGVRHDPRRYNSRIVPNGQRLDRPQDNRRQMAPALSHKATPPNPRLQNNAPRPQINPVPPRQNRSQGERREERPRSAAPASRQVAQTVVSSERPKAPAQNPPSIEPKEHQNRAQPQNAQRQERLQNTPNQERLQNTPKRDHATPRRDLRAPRDEENALREGARNERPKSAAPKAIVSSPGNNSSNAQGGTRLVKPREDDERARR